jgi:hypothetical protein
MRILKLLLLVAVAASIVAGVFYFSQQRSVPTYIVPDKEPAAQCYTEAAALLNSGKDTYKAIALLKHSIAAAPNAAAYHEALGCAYADKAAYVFRALYFRQRMAETRHGFSKTWPFWEPGSVHKDIFGYTEPRQKYHVYHMKDDGSRFIESNEDAKNEIRSLETDSEAQWAAALRLTQSASDQARVHYEKASVCCVFGAIGNYHILDREGAPDPVASKRYQEGAVEAATANHLAPNNALYWEAAGDIADDLVQENPVSSHDMYTRGLPPSHPYYLKALRLQPSNEDLWIRLSDEDHGNFKASQYDLQQANRLDPKNRFLVLLYINALYTSTHYENGGANDPYPGDRWKRLSTSLDSSDASTVKEVERLLLAARTPIIFNRRAYTYPYPPELAQGAKAATLDNPWGYSYWAELRNAARCIQGAAHCLAMQGKADQGIRLLIGLYNAASPMVTSDHYTGDFERNGKVLEALIGEALLEIAIREQTRIIDKYEPGTRALIADKALADHNAARLARNRMLRATEKRQEGDNIYLSY